VKNMAAHKCPHCDQESLSWWDKYKAAKWKILFCPKCGGRLCSNPYILVFYSILYVWVVLWFIFWAMHNKSWIYLLWILVGWVILDWFALYLPLCKMKPVEKNK